MADKKERQLRDRVIDAVYLFAKVDCDPYKAPEVRVSYKQQLYDALNDLTAFENDPAAPAPKEDRP